MCHLSLLETVMLADSICRCPCCVAQVALMISLWTDGKYWVLDNIVEVFNQPSRKAVLLIRQIRDEIKASLFFKANLRSLCY